MQLVSQLSAWTADDSYVLPPALAEIGDPPGAPGLPVLPGLGDGSGWDGLFSHAGHQPLWTERVHTEMGGPVLLTPNLTHRWPPGNQHSLCCSLVVWETEAETPGPTGSRCMWGSRRTTFTRPLHCPGGERWRFLRSRQVCSHLWTGTKCTLTLPTTRGCWRFSLCWIVHLVWGSSSTTSTLVQRHTRKTSRLPLFPPLAADLVLKVFCVTGSIVVQSDPTYR